MKQALILGCSHAIGAEMWMSPLSGLTQESSAEEKDGYGMTMCYPAIIARALGYQTNFRAISGGSNDAMFRILEQSRIKPPDIVIACWTGGNRTEIFNDQDHTWVPLSVGHKTEGIYMEYMKQWIFWVNTGEQSRLNKLKNIYALNMLAQIANNNRGAWRLLEAAERQWAQQPGTDFYIISGGIFDQGHPTTGNGLGIPTRLYKIIIEKNSRQVQAYLMPNAAISQIGRAHV